MNRERWMSAVLILSIALAAWPATALAADTNSPAVKIYAIGNPVWTPVDFHLFSAPIGTLETGYADFGNTISSLLPPPNHQFHPALGVGPGIAHPPPYNTELEAGLANTDFHEGNVFQVEEFSNGMAVLITWMTVPKPGTTGSSPDFASGPIIPNTLFPITISGDVLRNNKLFDPYIDLQVPALDENLDPPFFVDGHSHFPMFIADNADWGPPNSDLRGSYLYSIDMLDVTGNGWHIEARFAVVP